MRAESPGKTRVEETPAAHSWAKRQLPTTGWLSALCPTVLLPVELQGGLESTPASAVMLTGYCLICDLNCINKLTLCSTEIKEILYFLCLSCYKILNKTI